MRLPWARAFATRMRRTLHCGSMRFWRLRFLTVMVTRMFLDRQRGTMPEPFSVLSPSEWIHETGLPSEFHKAQMSSMAPGESLLCHTLTVLHNPLAAWTAPMTMRCPVSMHGMLTCHAST